LLVEAGLDPPRENWGGSWRLKTQFTLPARRNGYS